MSAHVGDLIPDYALGILRGAERTAVEAHIGGCPVCAAELAETSSAVELLALALETVAPPPGLKERILAATSSESRFAIFVDRVAKLIDQSKDLARRLLDSIDDATSWEAGPDAGSLIMHLPPGPALAGTGAVVGFVRVEPGVKFPHHRHLGDEVVLILQGVLRDEDGSTARRGDEVSKPAHSEHSFHSVGEAPLIYLVVLAGGVEFPGLPGFEV